MSCCSCCLAGRKRDRRAEGKEDGRKKVRRSAFEQERADNVGSIMGDAGALVSRHTTCTARLCCTAPG